MLYLQVILDEIWPHAMDYFRMSDGFSSDNDSGDADDEW